MSTQSNTGERPSTPEQTVYLIDGTAYIHRAFHAIQGLRNSKGMPTNAVFGFARMLIKLMAEKSPAFCAIVFDAKGPTFRHQLYAEYKANRPPMPEDMAVQIPFIKKLCRAFCLPVIEMAGYEADDLIGTLARQAQSAGYGVVMVTGDKDFVQLISEHSVQWDPMKDKRTDLSAVRNTYGLEPEQMIDVMGLSGDSSDNIPGVPGIGPKTALTLIQEFGSLTRLYEQLDRLKAKKQREKLVQYKDQALLSRQLAAIDTHAPVDFDAQAFKTGLPDETALQTMFRELEFRQLQQAYQQKTDYSTQKYTTIMDLETLETLVRQLGRARVFAVDTETTSENPMAARLVGVSLSMTPGEAFYIPCGHDYLGAPAQLSWPQIRSCIRGVLESPEIQKIGQNIKYDWVVLKRHGVNLAGVHFDTMLASYLINPSKRAHNLDQIALDFLNYKTTAFKELFPKGRVESFAQVPLEKAAPYACEDADITLAAQRVLQPEMEALGLMPLFNDVEMPLIPVLLKMEMQGVAVDRGRLTALSKSFAQQIERLESEIFTIAGEAFNVNSSRQLGRIMFEKLQLPVQKKTKKKTAYSTDVDVLTALAAHHELPALVLRHRTLSKLKSTYADALLELIHPETGRIHTSFNQTVTATGRLSSSEPNLQNIPIRTEEGRAIRSAFVPRPGWWFVSADYSQIELRILAHYAKDDILIHAFQQDEDIHGRTAAEVFQVPADQVSVELRRQAKVINFGIIYGMGAFSLARELGVSQKMAKTYIDHYFARYPGVKRFTIETIEDARQSLQTSTLLGRIRRLPDINSKNPAQRQFAERTAVNTPIQGTAADLIKVAMIRVAKAFAQEGLASAMLLTVHDEIIFEVPPEELETVCRRAAEIMGSVWDLRVPLKVNVARGKSWADAH